MGEKKKKQALIGIVKKQAGKYGVDRLPLEHRKS
jgi:hypothetical protein